MSKALTKKPRIIIDGGKPTAVILSIHDYEELLQRVEDVEDLAELKRLRRTNLKFRPFEEFLKDR